jgi:hypothetical protein
MRCHASALRNWRDSKANAAKKTYPVAGGIQNGVKIHLRDTVVRQEMVPKRRCSQIDTCLQLFARACATFLAVDSGGALLLSEADVNALQQLQKQWLH